MNDCRKSALPILYAVVFLAGSGTMILEMTATRAFQPFFGDSVFVWTNVVGVILFTLAAGYFLGGRAADAGAGIRAVALLLLLAGALATLTAFAVKPLAEALLPPPGSADLASSGRHLALGSLVASLTLFGPPVFLLAMTSPICVRVAAAGGLGAGRAAGTVFMFSTAGSIIGTYLPAWVLVPGLGTRLTILTVAALDLGLAAVLGLVAWRRAAALLPAAALALLSGPIRALPIRSPGAGRTVARETESRYQFVQVVEQRGIRDAHRPDDPAAARTELRLTLNEGIEEFHSVHRLEDATSGGKYYDTAALLPLLFPPPRPLRILVIGSGAGTVQRLLLVHYPAERIASVTGVELDPAVLALERDSGLPPSPRCRSVAADGRAFLAGTTDTWDIILIDAYGRQIYIPFHLVTTEFFRLARSRLAPDGILALNVTTFQPDAPLVRSIAATLQGVFPPAAATPVWRSWNVILWAVADGSPRPWPSEGPPGLGAQLLAARNFTADIRLRGDERILTDDHAPVDALTRDALRGAGSP